MGSSGSLIASSSCRKSCHDHSSSASERAPSRTCPVPRVSDLVRTANAQRPQEMCNNDPGSIAEDCEYNLSGQALSVNQSTHHFRVDISPSVPVSGTLPYRPESRPPPSWRNTLRTPWTFATLSTVSDPPLPTTPLRTDARVLRRSPRASQDRADDGDP